MGQLCIRVTPKSSREKIAMDGGIVRVWVHDPPVEGQANESARRLVAGALGVAPSAVTITHGQGSRVKTLQVAGLSDDEILRALQ